MNETTYIELLRKLDHTLNADGSIPSVSPALRVPGEACTRQGLYITPDMNVESLSERELLLAHVLVHKLYATGSKNVSKEQLKKLHDVIKTKIDHVSFDTLDA